MATYTTADFNLEAALNGALVGLNAHIDGDDSPVYGGTFREVISDYAPTYYTTNKELRCRHQVTVFGSTVWCKPDGKVVSCSPSLTGFTSGTQLYILVLDEPLEVTHGTEQTMTRSAESGMTNQIDIAIMEPRDHFAMTAMTAIMNKMDHPECIDDANLLQMCRTAYRWANGMMKAAADARTQIEEHTAPTPEEEDEQLTEVQKIVDIDINSLNSNTERLLYNIIAELHNMNVQDKLAFKDGMPVVGLPTVVNNVKVPQPVSAKLHADSEIKKLTEVTEVKKVTEVTEVKKVTEITDVKKNSDVTAYVNVLTNPINVNTSGNSTP